MSFADIWAGEGFGDGGSRFMGAHFAARKAATGSTSKSSVKSRRRTRTQRRIEPFAWLGASAVAFGMGAAALTCSAVAVADEGATDSPSTASSADPGTKPKTESSPPAGELSGLNSHSNGVDTDASATPELQDSEDRPIGTHDLDLDPLSGQDDLGGSAETDVEDDKPPTALVQGKKKRSGNDESAHDVIQTALPTRAPSAEDATFEGSTVRNSSPRYAAEPLNPQLVKREPFVVQQQTAAPRFEAAAATTALMTASVGTDALTSWPGDPADPVASPLGWALLTAARRHLGRSVDGEEQQQLFSVTDFGTAAVNTAPSATLIRQSSPGLFTSKVTGSVKASDPDGDSLTFTGMTTAKGTVTATSRGFFTYTPTAAARHAAASSLASAADKTDTFTVTVTDGNGGIAEVPVIINIRPSNSAPASLRSAVQKPDPVSGVVAGTVAATDRDGDSPMFSASTPKNGTVTINPDGSFDYTASPQARAKARSTWYTDADSFKVTLDDGHGGVKSLIVRVTIAPVNSAPTLGAPTMGSPDPATGIVNGWVNATDADGDKLTYTAATTTTANGTFAVSTTGAFAYAPTQEARHASATGLPGASTDSVAVTVTDKFKAASTLSMVITILPVNAAPTATLAIGEPDGDGVVRGFVAVTDADNDHLVFTSTTPAKGIAEVMPTGAIIYAPTQEARHRASADDATDADRQDSFTVIVTDGHGGTVELPVTVTLAASQNHSPAGATHSSTTNGETGVITGQLSAVDADGDALAYSGSVTTSKGHVIVGSGGSFIYTPTEAARREAGVPDAESASKTDSFTVIADDGHGGTLSIHLTVSILPLTIDQSPNHNPQLGIPEYGYWTNAATGVISGTVNVTDEDGDALSYTVSAAPESTTGQLIVDPVTGQWTFTPAASTLLAAWTSDEEVAVAFTISVSDGQATTAVTIRPTIASSSQAVIESVERFGSQPSGVAVGSDGRIYVLNAGANSLSIVDPADGSMTTVRVGRRPGAITLDDEGRVWVANTEDGTATVLDPDGNTLRTVTVGLAPTGIAAGNGKVYVANFGDDSVTVVDLFDGYTTTTLENVGANPMSVDVGVNGLIYVANFGDSSITIVDPNDSSAARRLDTGTLHPYGIAVSDDGTIYVTHPLNDLLTVLSPVATAVNRSQVTARTLSAVASENPSHSVEKVSVVGSPTSIVVDSVGRVYVTNSRGDTVTVFEPLTLAAREIAAGGRPNAVFVDAAGTVYVTNGARNTVSVIPPRSSTVLTYQVGVDTAHVTTDQDGNLILVSTYDGSISKWSAGERLPIPTLISSIELNTNFDMDLVLSRDGTKAYVPTFGGGIQVVDTVLYKSLGVIPVGGYRDWNGYPITESPQSAVVSRDGKTLYVSLSASINNGNPVPAGYDHRVAAIDLTSGLGTVDRYISVSGVSSDIEISPDGNRLFVMGYPDGSSSRTVLSILDVHSANRASDQFLYFDTGAPNLLQSPDGRRIYAFGPENEYIRVIDTSAPDVSQLPPILVGSGGYHSLHPLAISADSALLYVSRTNWAGGLEALSHLDGAVAVFETNHHTLVHNNFLVDYEATDFYDMHISPDGTRLIGLARAGGVKVVDIQSGKLLSSGPSGWFRALSNDGRFAYGTFWAPGVYVTVTDLYGDGVPRETGAPGSVEDLWNNVKAYTNDINQGIYIQTVRNFVDNKLRMVVYLGGTTDDFLSGNQAKAENIVSELRLVKEDQRIAIARKLTACSSDPSCGDIAEIMVVGYSQGGIDAQNLAQWNGFDAPISAIVTFGSPIVSNPPVATLHLRDRDDEVVNAELFARFLAQVEHFALTNILSASFLKPTLAAGLAGQVYARNAPSTAVNLTDLFYVHGTPSTYREISSEFDTTSGNEYTVQRSKMNLFFDGSLVTQQ